MTFFTLGNHRDFAITAVGDDAPDAPANSPGLYHVAFKIGNHIDQLREAKKYLGAAGMQVRAVDHGVSKSIYVKDPDGNSVKLYIDASDVWKLQPEAVAQASPLDLYYESSSACLKSGHTDPSSRTFYSYGITDPLTRIHRRRCRNPSRCTH